MTPIYCLDTMIVGWAFKKRATEGQEQKVLLAQKLLEIIDAEKAIILIPSVVFAEIGVKLTDQELKSFQEGLPKRCYIASFDAKAASLFGEIWRKNTPVASAMRDDNTIDRVKMKFDYQIVAIAKSQNVTCLYSDDRNHLKKFAESFVTVKSLSDLEEPQQALPLEVRVRETAA